MNASVLWIVAALAMTVTAGETMPDTVKLPAVGPVKKQWVYVGGALIAGIVGYAYWTRSRQPAAPTAEDLAAAIPQDREPPPTVVGSESFDTSGVRDIISTNDQWYRAAISYMVDLAGYDFQAVTTALGKFLARKPLTAAEVNYVQIAKGATGEPPLSGPWPIVTAQPPPASQPPTAGKPGVLVGWHGHRMNSTVSWDRVAAYYANSPSSVNSIEATLRGIAEHNRSYFSQDPHSAHKGWIVVVPLPTTRRVTQPSP